MTTSCHEMENFGLIQPISQGPLLLVEDPGNEIGFYQCKVSCSFDREIPRIVGGLRKKMRVKW